MLQQKILNDLKVAIKNSDVIRRDTLRIVIAEFQRKSNPHDPIADNEVLSILNKLVKSERELLSAKNIKEDSEYINILSEYLPEIPSKETVINWILSNCDGITDTPKNQRNKFMKQIMSEFKGLIDGKLIQQYIQEIE